MFRPLIFICLLLDLVVGSGKISTKHQYFSIVCTFCESFVSILVHIIHKRSQGFIISFIYIFFLVEKKCNSEEILKAFPECPTHSTNCVEDGVMNGTNGTCECIHGKIFNEKYTSDADYCVYSSNLGINSIHPESNVQNKTKFENSPHPHHVIIGVSILLFFVSVLIGSIYVCKRLHIYQRFRNIRRTNRRPFYEDVMLRNNDIDDPPLI